MKHCEARVLDDGQRLARSPELAAPAAPRVRLTAFALLRIRQVLLASGAPELSEAELKATAAALGKGYVLSQAPGRVLGPFFLRRSWCGQVKIVENDAWKFNTSGKLLRNAVPLDSDVAEDVKKDAWETFVKEGASELEREIAACLAPQLSGVDQWNCNSHFMEDDNGPHKGFQCSETRIALVQPSRYVLAPMCN